MKFTNHTNKLMRPYIVYADPECSLIPSDDPNKIATHVTNSACIYFVCNYDAPQNKKMIWYGENCIYDMVLELYKIAEACVAKMRENNEMALTLDDKRDFYNSTPCHICGCEVRDTEPKSKRPRPHNW